MISSIQFSRRVNGKRVLEPYLIEDPKLRNNAKEIAAFKIIDAPRLNRTVVFHCGVPNSGKTYSALLELQKAKKGIYCAPLRLMAYEVYENLTKLGINCNLLTGEEQIMEHKHPQIVCCTIEMTPFAVDYDIAIIDEIQMMNCKSRGFAWTRAYLKLKSKTLHVCGDVLALPLMERLSTVTNDSISTVKYLRKTPLVLDTPLSGNYSNLKKGDAVAVFSRQAVFEYKRLIESNTNFKCAVIYGALPKQPRCNQADMFNSGLREILVCTDAIGLGLNLNIKRVVFMTLKRKIFREFVPVEHSQIHQIAGRAGRFGIFEKGYTTTFHNNDFKLLSDQISSSPSEPIKMGFFPSYEQLTKFKKCLPFVNKFSQLISTFQKYSACEAEDAFLCDMNSFVSRVNLLDTVALRLQDIYYFCLAPCNVSCPKSSATLLAYAKAFSAEKYVDIVDLLTKLFPDLLHPSFNNEVVWGIMDECQQPSQFSELASDLVVFNGITYDSPLIKELEVFYRVLSLISYLRFRHDKLTAFVKKGYSHFNTWFLLDYLKTAAEDSLTDIMNLDSEVDELDVFDDLDEFEGDGDLLADLDIAMQNYMMLNK
eukprot:NODE_116_length_19003_cov_0.233707.p2 type:complete len:594 gc:universal NODE_116_length_19003_cov_0.233707:1641-3422(+)